VKFFAVWAFGYGISKCISRPLSFDQMGNSMLRTEDGQSLFTRNGQETLKVGYRGSPKLLRLVFQSCFPLFVLSTVSSRVLLVIAGVEAGLDFTANPISNSG
jgi:hypothetical protein